MNFNPTSLNDTAQVKEGLERFGNVYITKPNSRHTVEKPGSKGATIFRIYPFVDKSNPQAPAIMPLRNPNTPQKGYADNELYASIIRLPVMDYAGVNGKFTAIASVYGQDLNFKGPLETFVKAMNSNLKATPQKFPIEWRAWYKEKSKEDGDNKMGDSSPIPFPNVRGFVQGALYANNGKSFTAKGSNTPDPRKPVLLMLMPSATLALLAKANEHRKKLDASGNIIDVKEGDFDAVFQYNRMVDPTYGYSMVIAYEKGGGGLLSHYNVTPEQIPTRDPATGAVSSACNVVPIDPNEVVNNFVPWGELIHFMTEKEQVALLLQHYPPAAVDFGLRGSQFYDLLPPEAKGKWDDVAKQVVSGAPWQPSLTAPGALPGMGAPMPGAPVPQTVPQQQAPDEQPPASWGWPLPAPGYRYVNKGNNNWVQEPIPAPAQLPPPPPPAPAAQTPPPPPPPPAAPAAPAAQAHWTQGQVPPNAFPAAPTPSLPPPPTGTTPPPPPAPAAQVGAAPLPPGVGPVTPATSSAMEELRKRMNGATAAASAAPLPPPPPAQ